VRGFLFLITLVKSVIYYVFRKSIKSLYVLISPWQNVIARTTSSRVYKMMTVFPLSASFRPELPHVARILP